MDDETGLVRRAADGEREAFASLYDRYSRPMFFTLLGLLRTRDDAEDALLASLDPGARSLVLLRAVHGWSAEESARALGVSPATVRRRYARALGHLKKRLGNGGGDEQ